MVLKSAILRGVGVDMGGVWARDGGGRRPARGVQRGRPTSCGRRPTSNEMEEDTTTSHHQIEGGNCTTETKTGEELRQWVLGAEWKMPFLRRASETFKEGKEPWHKGKNICTPAHGVLVKLREQRRMDLSVLGTDHRPQDGH